MASSPTPGARVLYRLPEQRRLGAGGMPAMLAMLAMALVLFAGGLVVGRATMTGNEPAGGAATATTTAPAATAAPSPAAAATPGTAAAPAQATAASRVGPRRVENGVGVGYARSQQGAVAAAANYTRVLSSDVILDEARRRAAVETLAAPEARARLQRTLDQAVESLRQGLGVAGAAGAGGEAQVLLRATPVGWRMTQYGDGAATVAIWVMGMGGSIGGADGPVPIREGWGTTTVRLRWVDGDWKQVSSTTVDGPLPIADVSPPTAAPELVSKASEFKEFTYAPGP